MIPKVTSKQIREEVARLSPPEFASQIIQRNEAALKVLKDEIYPHIKNRTNSIDFEKELSFGCPHCNVEYDCDGCIWVNVLGNIARKQVVDWDEGYEIDGEVEFVTGFFCTQVKFGGFDHAWVSSGGRGDHGYIHIDYGNKKVFVIAQWEFDSEYDVKDIFWGMIEEEYQECVKFLKGHIQWAKMKSWGKKYKKE